MLRTGLARAGGAILPSRMLIYRTSSSSSVSTAVNSNILRSLEEHSTEIFKQTLSPMVIPPRPFTVVKGDLDSGGPVLKRAYGDEEISISARRMVDIISSGDDYYNEDQINQMFILVDVSKPGHKDALHFFCGLYPDALGIRSVAMREKLETSGYLVVPNKYNGPSFEELDERMKDALYGYIEERGIDHSLFPFLQAWLYVKDHGNLIRWFKSMGTFVSVHKQDSGAQQS